MNTFTITLEVDNSETVHSVDGTHYAKHDGNVFVYNEDETLVEVNEEHFVSIIKE